MSVINVHRNIPVTPLSNQSPAILYCTSSTKERLGNKSQAKYKQNNHLSVTQSAKIFKMRDRLKRRRYYQLSPCTPRYKRFQRIKKRLNFDDSCENIAETVSSDVKTHQRELNVPRVTVTSCNGHTEEPLNRDYFQMSAPGIYHGVTPNVKNILLNLSPLRKRRILNRSKFGYTVESRYKGSKVAVKIIHNRQKDNTLLENEINGLGLKHQNIVTVLSIAWSNRCNIFHSNIVVMEHFEGAMNLQTVLNTAALDVQKTLDYSMDISNALGYLHSNGILHLDVRPNNVIVLTSNTCKLCDFGASLKTNQQSSDFRHIYQIAGQLHYCSPEMLLSRRPTTSSDVYSLGITMWQMVHRVTPFDLSIRQESLIYQIVKCNLRPSISTYFLNSSSLMKYSRLFSDCWRQNPNSRPSLDVVLTRLKYIKDGFKHRRSI